MTPQQLRALRDVLSALDDRALIALSNKGLVRRGAKDAKAGGLSHRLEADHVVVRGPGWTVRMPPEGPRVATDDSRATGVTRHVIAATLYLQSHLDAGSAPVGDGPGLRASAPAAGAEARPDRDFGDTLTAALTDVEREALEKWATRTRLAEARLRASEPVEVETDHRLVVRWPERGVEVIGLPGIPTWPPKKLLDALEATSAKVERRLWVAAAVLALQRAAGRSLEAPPAALGPAPGAPRPRATILAETRHALTSLVGAGLAHPSLRAVERLSTLAQAAVGVQLPRLGRVLTTLSDEVLRMHQRHATADARRLFEALARAHALAVALARAGDGAPAALVGHHRTRYEPVGSIELVGVGAHPWRTASGYSGLTAVFWWPERRGFCTWSESRPDRSPPPLDLEETYRHHPLWAVGPVADVCRQQLRVAGAKMNGRRRLSGSSAIRGERLGPSAPAAIEWGEVAFDDWSAVGRYAVRQRASGLRAPEPLADLVVVRPAAWGARAFDEVGQRFIWTLFDPTRRELALSLRWTEINRAAIAFMEALDPERERLYAVLGRLSSGGLTPLTFFGQGGPSGVEILNPAFDIDFIASKRPSRRTTKRGAMPTRTTLLDPDPETSDPVLPEALERLLAPIEARLLTLAERGVGRARPDDELTALGQRAAGVGWARLARTIARDLTPAVVLEAGYLVQVYRSAGAPTVAAAV